MKTLFSLIWGQCTEVIQAKIKAVQCFEDVSDNANSLAHLGLLKKESYNFQTRKNPAKAEAKWCFYHLMQEKSSCHKGFCDRFNNCIDVARWYSYLLQ